MRPGAAIVLEAPAAIRQKAPRSTFCPAQAGRSSSRASERQADHHCLLGWMRSALGLLITCNRRNVHCDSPPALPERKNVATAIAKTPMLANIRTFVILICRNNAGSVIGIWSVQKKTLLNFLCPAIEKSDGLPSFVHRSALCLNCLESLNS